MTPLIPSLRALALFMAFLMVFVAVAVSGCGGGRRAPATPRGTPAAAAAAPASESPQALYESGRYRDVLARSGGAAGAEAIWFAAQSHARLGERDEAARQFARLPGAGATPAWELASGLALALLADDASALDRLRTTPAPPADPFAQFELGLAHARRGDQAAAARAFDEALAADPYFAYAYYNAALAYDRLNRPDLAVARLETFRRLAPDAPERPGVDAILRTTAGQ